VQQEKRLVMPAPWVLVVGLGKSGRRAARWLARAGYQVRIADQDPRTARCRGTRLLAGAGVHIHVAPHSMKLLDDIDLLVLSPGVRTTSPLVTEARRRHVPVVGELELGYRHLKAGRLVGITGTNGKTTTTRLITYLVARTGHSVGMAGNVGRPLCALLDREPEVIVCEVSSFQLETTSGFRPDISCVLNISRDHLDRHGSLERYAAIKRRILRNQDSADVAVLNADDDLVRSIQRGTRSRPLWFSQQNRLKEGLFIEADSMCYRVRGAETRVPLNGFELNEPHNRENALAAVGVCLALGMPLEVCISGLAGFRVPPHRVERVARIGEVVFINDSKATNEGAVKRCLQSVSGPVVLILGGRDKGADFAALRPEITGKVRLVVALGEAQARIHRQLGTTVPVERVAELPHAVRRAFDACRPRGTVVLSPGCASFDQFRNYADRGNQFKALVDQLRRQDATRRTY